MSMQTINQLTKTNNYFSNSGNNKMNQLFTSPVKTLRVIAISSMVMAGSIAAHAQVKVGANPANITSNSVLDVEGTSAQRTVILQNGNMGINQAVPTNKLHVKDAANPVRFEGLQQGDMSQRAMSTDASGVLTLQSIKYIATGPSTYQMNLGNTLNNLPLDNSINGGSPSVFTSGAFVAPEAGTYEIEVTVSVYIPSNQAFQTGGLVSTGLNGSRYSSIYFGSISQGNWDGKIQSNTFKTIINLNASQAVNVEAGGYGECNANNGVRVSYFSAQKIKN